MRNITPTFNEQYQKIVSAYYKNKLQPYRGCACFVGNLLNNNKDWENIRDFNNGVLISLYIGELTDIKGDRYITTTGYNAIKTIKNESNNLYNPEDILKLENNFIDIITKSNEKNRYNKRTELGINEDYNYTEESLYKAMESTLLLLRQIHESKGEVIQDYNFTKRKLEKSSI